VCCRLLIIEGSVSIAASQRVNPAVARRLAKKAEEEAAARAAQVSIALQCEIRGAHTLRLSLFAGGGGGGGSCPGGSGGACACGGGAGSAGGGACCGGGP
jgi:RNA 3'-terminal phosphate cyclase